MLAANKNAVRRAGGIPFLADLLRAGPQNKASYYAAGAIANVAAFNQPCQDAVREADALQLIIALLQASLAVGVDARWVVRQPDASSTQLGLPASCAVSGWPRPCACCTEPTRVSASPPAAQQKGTQ